MLILVKNAFLTVVLIDKSCPTLCNPMDCSNPQVPLFKGFPRQEYWSGLPFPSLGDFRDPGIKLATPALASRFVITESQGKLPIYTLTELQNRRCQT